jgi:hypothetical protein
MRVSASLPIEVLKMAYDSVIAHKFRSFLTILGIVVGILTAVVVASIHSIFRLGSARRTATNVIESP